MDEKVVLRELSQLQRWDKERESEVKSCLSVRLLFLSGLTSAWWRAAARKPCSPSSSSPDPRNASHSLEQTANSYAVWGQQVNVWTGPECRPLLEKKRPTLWPEFFSFTHCWGCWSRSAFHQNHQARRVQLVLFSSQRGAREQDFCTVYFVWFSTKYFNEKNN